MKPKWLAALEEAVQAGIRGIILLFNTTDRVVYPEFGPPLSLKFFLASYLAKQGYAVAGYSMAAGLQELRPPGVDRPEDAPFREAIARGSQPEQALPALSSLLRNGSQKIAVIIDYADHLVPSSQGMSALLSQPHLLGLEILHGWGTDDAIRKTENLIILVSHENQVNDLLMRGGSGYRTLHIDLPCQDERGQFIQLVGDVLSGSSPTDRIALSEDLSLEELARITSGLRFTDLEAIFRLAQAKKESISRSLVSDWKARAIKELCRDLVEVHEPDHGFEAVAGLPHAIEYMNGLKWRVEQGDEGVPQAILLAGVPGSGKSFLVLALAKELGYPCLAMRNIREKWVGASERNLELVLWVAETLAPCIIWIDELDQALGQRNTGDSADAGTSERMLSRIWEFMGSMRHRGKVLWLATTNRPDLLDAATLDRFQVVIPFLHPTPQEVTQLLPVVAKQVGRQLGEDVRLQEIASLPALQLPTVRNLQEVVSMAGALADFDAGVAGSLISHKHLEEAALDFKPNYDPLQHEFIALNAIRMTSFHSLLPWRCRDGRRQEMNLPSYVEGLVDTEGMVVVEELEARLRDLKGHLWRERFG